MAFQQGLSGLNVSSKALDAVGNNIANSQTVGFKAASAQFVDVFASALVGGAGNQIGQGGSIGTIAQTFTQGNVTASNNPLDIAVNGNGFLRFQPSLTDATAEYGRNGQLFLNKDGFIVNAQQQFLNAFASPDGINIDQTQSVPIQINSAQLPPRVTGFNNTIAGGNGGLQVGINMDVRDKRADTAGNTPATGTTALQPWDFNTLNSNMFNFSTSASIFDQRGESHILTMYFVRGAADDGTGNFVATANYTPHVVIDDQFEVPVINTGTGATGTINFTPSGQLDTTTSTNSRWVLDLANAVDSAGTTVPLTVFPNDLFPTPSLGANGYDLSLDFATATSFGSAYDVNKLTQDGFAPGRLSGIAIDADGIISARFSNGQTQVQGQIALATFQNPNGLQSLGGNLWAETAASGAPLAGVPNSGSRGAIQSGAIEEANVDLTAELVAMIVLQRSYQANAQTIRTQDQILQTLVNLR